MTTHLGKVVESVGGFHTVIFSDHEPLRIQARGSVKRKGALLVGDCVEVSTEDGGVVERVLARRSELVRPPIANVDLVVVALALCEPAPSFLLLDRILAQAEQMEMESLVIFNKRDLVDPLELQRAARPYREAGYSVIGASALSGDGVGELSEAIGGRIAVMAGPSGVGKTSLLRRLTEDDSLETGAVSEKSSRGRHTTRAVRLLPLAGGGWIADSPGFSTMSLGVVDPREARLWYPEFRPLQDECRFAGCLHRSEPGCAVQEAVRDERLDPERYSRYLRLLAEVEEAYERRY